MVELVHRRDLDFMLHEVLDLSETLAAPRFADWDREAIDQILDTARVLSADAFAPLAQVQDEHEPRFVEGRVEEVDGIPAAIAAFAEAGFIAAGFDQEVGGLQLPFSVCKAAHGYFQAANVGLYGYALLTAGNANVIRSFGTEAQQATYLPKMLAGEWLGTMCLSEPQAGSSLSDITTKATPTDEDHYLINGTKMWISGGDNSFSDNIIHLVLARIEGAPPGVKGISLFIVPKNRVNDDGTVGESNNVILAGLNHKMGQRGLTNALLNFGEKGDCRGYLIGEPHQGLAYMFQMMNEARIDVGQIATMLGYAGYRYSLDYAMNRPQGRPIAEKDPTKPQVMIIEHADIKRLLTIQKTYAEGALGLCLYCADLVDRIEITENAEKRQQLSLLLDILTPIAKSWPSEFCLEANKHAIQVLGGYGYTREYPAERFYRDNRLNPIHEGTHGIQGIDMLGRKVRMAKGAAFAILGEQIRATADAAERHAGIADLAKDLHTAVAHIEAVTAKVVAEADLERSLANATEYLDALGHIVIGWIWLKQAVAASEGLADATGTDADFYQGKLNAARFFFRHDLPKARTTLEYIASFDDTARHMTAAQF